MSRLPRVPTEAGIEASIWRHRGKRVGAASITARFRRYYGLALLGIAAALWAAPALAAGPSLTLDKIDASAFPSVRASVSVLNASGQPALGLDASSFAVSEDGQAVSDVRVEPFVDRSE